MSFATKRTRHIKTVCALNFNCYVYVGFDDGEHGRVEAWTGEGFEGFWRG
jgi:hypothetical protein